MASTRLAYVPRAVMQEWPDTARVEVSAVSTIREKKESRLLLNTAI
jgi:hypothetical protein